MTPGPGHDPAQRTSTLPPQVMGRVGTGRPLSGAAAPATTPAAAAPVLRVMTGLDRPLLATGTRGRLRSRLSGAAVHLLVDVHRAAPSAPVAATDAALAVAGALVAGLPSPLAAAVGACFVLVGWLTGTYADRDQVQSRGMAWLAPAIAPALVVVAILVATAGNRPGDETVTVVGAVALNVLLLRCVTGSLLVALRSRGHAMTPTLVLGPPHVADVVVRRLRQLPHVGLDPVETHPLEVALATDDVARLVARSGAGHVIVIPDAYENVAVATALRRRQGIDASFSLVPPLADLCLRPVHATEVGGIPMISLGRALRGRKDFPGKRMLDLLLVLPMLALALPVIAVAAAAIKLDDRGPVLFRQPRVGRDGRTFHMLKLRTMTVGAAELQTALHQLNVTDGLLFKAAGDPRITRVGALLRRLSVDELPQLWNVWRGEMSLVGPRPLPVQAEAFGPLDGQRHVAPPGITGYWQVSGGNGLTYDEMVRLDLAYIDNWSMMLDLRLLLRTLPALLVRRGPA